MSNIYRGAPRSLVAICTKRSDAHAKRDELKAQGITAWVELVMGVGLAIYRLDSERRKSA